MFPSASSDVTTVSNEVLEAERRAHKNTLRKLEEASTELDMLFKKVKESESQSDKVTDSPYSNLQKLKVDLTFYV